MASRLPGRAQLSRVSIGITGRADEIAVARIQPSAWCGPARNHRAELAPRTPAEQPSRRGGSAIIWLRWNTLASGTFTARLRAHQPGNDLSSTRQGK